MCSVRLRCENLIPCILFPPSDKNLHIIPLIPSLLFFNLHALDTGGGHGRDCLLQLRGSVERSVRQENQCHCLKPGCQRVRKAAYKRYKMRTDPDYRFNQRLSRQNMG